MGILHDYFRAPDASAAVDWSVGPGGNWDQHSGAGLNDHDADWFDAKGLDPNVVLGQLVAFAKGVPFDVHATAPALVWPDERLWPQGEDRPGQDSPWETGLLLQRLPDEWIATLAEIHDEHLPLLALQWFDIPEAPFADFIDVQDTIAAFRALACRARDHGHAVYCKTVV
ncbi:hypothetical protein [Streptomyces sp. Act143]|uniref:hypothetical protein n=1 Tax=Streptomyces sp. Act143 TaxID=2200760 RepID=UPI0011B3C750|nr:hypothetical protein [Streptomyces sp. Act143]